MAKQKITAEQFDRLMLHYIRTTIMSYKEIVSQLPFDNSFANEVPVSYTQANKAIEYISMRVQAKQLSKVHKLFYYQDLATGDLTFSLTQEIDLSLPKSLDPREKEDQERGMYS